MKEGGRRAAFPARQEAKGLLPPRLTHRSSADVRAQLTKSQRTGRDGAAVPEGRAVPGGRDCLSFCRGCLCVLHLLQVASGLHRTHRVHGHLRDHSPPLFLPPPGRRQSGGRLGTAALPARSPGLGPLLSGTSFRRAPTCGVALLAAKGPCHTSTLSHWKTFCPLRAFAKEKSGEGRKGENPRVSTSSFPLPRLSEEADGCRSISATTPGASAASRT